MSTNSEQMLARNGETLIATAIAVGKLDGSVVVHWALVKQEPEKNSLEEKHSGKPWQRNDIPLKPSSQLTNGLEIFSTLQMSKYWWAPLLNRRKANISSVNITIAVLLKHFAWIRALPAQRSARIGSRHLQSPPQTTGRG